jgi:hypothetical protein
MNIKSVLFAAIMLASPRFFGQITPPAPPPTISVIDSSGNTYTVSSEGPVTPGAAQTQPGGGVCQFDPIHQIPCTDVHIIKTDSSGNVIFGTLLGGPGNDNATGVAVDSSGAIYVTGSAGSGFPTTPNAAIKTTTSALGFIAKLSPDGSKFLYATYLPRSGSSTGIAVDGQGNAYVTGLSESAHAFAAKLSADGSAFPYDTTFGGSKLDQPRAIAVDSVGNVTIVGFTNSSDFPVSAAAIQSQLTGVQNVFIARLNAAGAVTASTLLGGTGADNPATVQLDSSGNVYVAGSTTSLDFPTSPGAFEATPVVPLWNLGPGGFAAKLSPDLSALRYSTYVMLYDNAGAVKDLAL